MSMGDADAKFPGQQGLAEPPSPSRENPGQVYPKSDPSPAPSGTVPGTGIDHSPERLLGNPYLERGLFDKLDNSLSEVIDTIEREQSGMGGTPEERALVDKFKGWRSELVAIRSGQGGVRKTTAPPADGVYAEEGGMFTD